MTLRKRSFAYRASAFLLTFVMAAGSFCSAAGQGTNHAPKSLIDLTSPAAAKQLTPVQFGEQGNPKGSVIEPGPKGLDVHFPPHQSGDYDHPGFFVRPADGKPWDLSAYGHIEARVTNTGSRMLPFVMQVEDGSGGLNNLESMQVKPGETKVLKVVFGYQYGYEGDSPIHLKNITEIFIFCWGTSDPHDFRLEGLAAAGSPGEKPEIDPASIRYRPPAGVVFGKGASFNAAKQIGTEGSRATVSAEGRLEINGEGKTTINPPSGQWDFAAGDELRLHVLNRGKSTVSPTIVIGPIAAKVQQPIAPGAEADINVSFAAYPEAGLDSSRVPDIEILTSHGESLSVASIAVERETEDVPGWLGSRPPVEGDWTKTLDDEFDGASLDYKLWNIYGAEAIPKNYFWDRNQNPRHIVHFSNIFVQDGKAVIRLDKQTGRLNDMPGAEISDYASALLTTYGKWTQRYGYFETRVKLPVALGGVWATFDLIPDRGKAVTAKANRISVAKLPADTGVGGTEFDVLDDYSAQGPDRVNATVLADKVLGTANPYVLADKEGFLTVGLLWLPGKAVVYYNGKPALQVVNPRVGDVEAYIKFDLILGGVNRQRDEALQFPNDLSIDYVRVWQRKDLASPLDGAKPNVGDPNENNN
jgi:beta-glucanase (GH16 family)